LGINIVLQCRTSFRAISRAAGYRRLVRIGTFSFDGLTQRDLEVRATEEGSAGRHAMKKLINGPETVVTDALAGMAAAHPPGLRWGW
jgi:hypothetical protein